MSRINIIQSAYDWTETDSLDTHFFQVPKKIDLFTLTPEPYFIFLSPPINRDVFFGSINLQNPPAPSLTEDSLCITEIGKGVFSALTQLGTDFVKGIFDFQPPFIGTIAGLESLYQGTIHFFSQGLNADTASIANELTLLFSTALLITFGLKSHCGHRNNFNTKRRFYLEFDQSRFAYEVGKIRPRIAFPLQTTETTPHIVFMSSRHPSRPPKSYFLKGSERGAKKSPSPDHKLAGKSNDHPSFPDEPTQIDQTFFVRKITDIHMLTKTIGTKAVELRALVTERTGHYGERSRHIIAQAKEELHGFQKTRLIARDAQKQLERLMDEMSRRLGELEREYSKSLGEVATQAGEKNPMKLRREEIVVSALKARVRETAEAIKEDYKLWTEEIQRKLFEGLNQMKENRHLTPSLKKLIEDFLRKIGID